MAAKILVYLGLILGISTAYATVYEGTCATAQGADEAEWTLQLDTDAGQVAQFRKVLAKSAVELSVIPGGAAFADVLTLTVQTQQTEFRVSSLISSVGYGSVIYDQNLVAESWHIECQVRKIKN